MRDSRTAQVLRKGKFLSNWPHFGPEWHVKNIRANIVSVALSVKVELKYHLNWQDCNGKEYFICGNGYCNQWLFVLNIFYNKNANTTLLYDWFSEYMACYDGACEFFIIKKYKLLV